MTRNGVSERKPMARKRVAKIRSPPLRALMSLNWLFSSALNYRDTCDDTMKKHVASNGTDKLHEDASSDQ